MVGETGSKPAKRGSVVEDIADWVRARKKAVESKAKGEQQPHGKGSLKTLEMKARAEEKALAPVPTVKIEEKPLEEEKKRGRRIPKYLQYS